MTSTLSLRIAAALAGLMGAIGVALAAAAAHLADARQLGIASSMLLFHACAVIGTVLLVHQGLVRRRLGLTAAYGFVLAGILFGGDLVSLHYAGHSLFPMAAPTGGTLFIVCWLMVAAAALSLSRTPRA
ncbi:DUF423 domain-containing protein [Afipia felis]|uniref:Protein of uncharacterized function (DUF423) n=2 Tax=Afipia felis TaxID=1035 RepID=A0A380W3V9_AFIFE|nr:DUF423 domain-containing protein [Afipia felis]EKS30734.1 hypothetical protein HMPREF9697_03262 [Afipia felis ATCC 53690]SUU75479.1 Protein of uncharacterised function (DUF423) [Afipia felis]SUU83546.1 Protein of uncharacterised function (DUF423) [Afipia felis]